MKDLCMDCKHYKECPVLDWEWTKDIKELYANSPLPRKPKVTISITTCNEYEKSTHSTLDRLISNTVNK